VGATVYINALAHAYTTIFSKAVHKETHRSP
jgi:hypothetical protein